MPSGHELSLTRFHLKLAYAISMRPVTGSAVHHTGAHARSGFRSRGVFSGGHKRQLPVCVCLSLVGVSPGTRPGPRVFQIRFVLLYAGLRGSQVGSLVVFSLVVVIRESKIHSSFTTGNSLTTCFLVYLNTCFLFLTSSRTALHRWHSGLSHSSAKGSTWTS